MNITGAGKSILIKSTPLLSNSRTHTTKLSKMIIKTKLLNKITKLGLEPESMAGGRYDKRRRTGTFYEGYKVFSLPLETIRRKRTRSRIINIVSEGRGHNKHPHISDNHGLSLISPEFIFSIKNLGTTEVVY